MKLSIIVAASENNAIGKNNQMLWNLPEDMRFFKNTTWGFPLLWEEKHSRHWEINHLQEDLILLSAANPDYKAGNPEVQEAGQSC